MPEIKPGVVVEVVYTVRCAATVELVACDFDEGRTGIEAVAEALIGEGFPWHEQKLDSIESIS